MTETLVPAGAILEQIDRLVRFPAATICRHYVAAILLDLLERHGYPLTKELAGAVVRADDEIALGLLSEAIKNR